MLLSFISAEKKNWDVDATSDRQNDKIITWHARRFANGAEWKIESEEAFKCTS